MSAEHGDRELPVGDPRPLDESMMPMRMGDRHRVADIFYGPWGLVYNGEAEADAAYHAEWKAGNEGQLGLVKQASIEAGLGNYSDLLNDRTAEAVAHLLIRERSDSALRIIDIGSGPGTTVLATYEALPDHLKRVAEFVLIDPSEGSLMSAQKVLTEKGIKYEIHKGSDSEVLGTIPEGSFDVLTGVASIHHHARIPFDEYRRVLREGGFAVFGDWHNSMWRSPASVFHDFLMRMDWPRREEGLAEWLRVYPQAAEIPVPPQDPLDRRANDDIARFWQAYQKIQNATAPGANAIWPLEGHSPVKRYVEDMQKAGFSLNTYAIDRVLIAGIAKDNPHQIRPDSSLLQLTIGQKI